MAARARRRSLARCSIDARRGASSSASRGHRTKSLAPVSMSASSTPGSLSSVTTRMTGPSPPGTERSARTDASAPRPRVPSATITAMLNSWATAPPSGGPPPPPPVSRRRTTDTPRARSLACTVSSVASSLPISSAFT
jgi:hypothetical protein